MSAENFTIAAIGRQVDGTFNEDNRWSAHRYTTGTGDSVGSQEAREAIDEAIDAAGGENDNIEQAISSYNNGNFENAQSLADEAESGAQSSQLMMIAAGVVIVLALVGGGIYYWRENRDQGHKLQ